MSIYLAASDATQYSKNRADIVCTGTDDQEQIEAALNLLPANGGQIKLSEGTFALSETLELIDKRVAIDGEGPQSTTLLVTLAESGHGIEVGSVGARPLALRGLGIVAGNDNLDHGLHVTPHTAYSTFGDLWIEGANTGVYGESGNSQNLFEAVRVRDCLSYGFSSFGVANVFLGCLVSRGKFTVGLGGIAGFHIHDIGSTFTGCIVDLLTNGIYVASYATGVSFHGLHAERCGVGIRVQASEPDQPRGVSFYGGLVIDSQDETEAAVHVHRSESVMINGLQVKDTTSGVSIRVTDSARRCALVNNRPEDAQPYDIPLDTGAVVVSA